MGYNLRSSRKIFYRYTHKNYQFDDFSYQQKTTFKKCKKAKVKEKIKS